MISVLLPPSVTGVIVFVLLVGGTAMVGLVLLPLALVKVIPFGPVRSLGTRLCIGVALRWAEWNRIVYHAFYPVSWSLETHGDLLPGKSYLLVSNHQSWIDILMLVEMFHGKTPFPRFFLKHELLFVPVIGWGCWALDMPFMKRHSQAEIEKNPELRNDDIEATRAACQMFRKHPVTLVNFAEGTRCTESKRVAQNSPYRHLLRPKAAGLSFALNTMGEQFAGIIDLTIAYRPTKYPVVWSFLTGEQVTMAIHADVIDVPAELALGDYQGDAAFRKRFQDWINGIWARKDARLERMINDPRAAARARTT